MGRTALFVRKQAGGVFTVESLPDHPGDIWFVGSAVTGATDSVGYGKNPDAPFATLDYAVGQCAANNGDVIYVLPGHAETINAAAAIDLDVAGITVIGLGNGEDRPTITVGSSLDTATVEIGAADIRIKNLIFQPGNDGVDILLDINADGAIVENCEFRSDEANAYQADTYIDVNGGANGADRCTIRHCKIVSVTAGATQGIEIGAVEDALLIEECWIDGDFTAAGIHSASIFTTALVRGNAVSNRNSGNHAIEFSAACTGLLVSNHLYGDTLGTILDPGSLKCLDNWETDAIDQSGVATPRTAAGGFPNDSITAASVADAAIDAATFAADALQSFQDEAEDALEGENLDHLAAVTTVAADMTAEVVDGSILSRILSKTSDTSTYSPTTDALEMASDKLGAFSGDGGAAQDDSVKASLDLAHTDLDAILADTGTDGVVIAAGAITAAKFGAGAIDAAAIAAAAIDAATFAADALQSFQDEAEDALEGENLDHLAAVTTVAADMTAEVVDGSILSRVLSKTSDTSTYDPTTDALEMASDKLGAFSGDGGAAQDDSVKASLDLAHTDLDAILADTGTDGVVIAAGGIVASKFGVSAGEYTTDGIVVTRATAALPQSTSGNIFTVTGLCLVKRILGYVTTVIGGGANAAKLKVNSTGAGATTDISGTLDINAAAVDTRLEITGTFVNAIVATIDLPLAKVQVTEIVVPPGTIMLDCAGSDGGTGRVRWSVTYVPLEAGAQIVAA